MMGKKAQQEMVGFILIVLLVVVGIVIYIAIGANRPIDAVESKYAQNIMTSVLEYTTDCVVSEPFRLNVRELISEAKFYRRCKNLDVDSYDYLNTTIVDIMNTIMNVDPTITYYHFRIGWTDDEYDTPETFFEVQGGVCKSGVKLKSDGRTDKGSGDIVIIDKHLNIYFEICTEDLN